MFKRFIFPFIVGQILTYYTITSMFDVSLADTSEWPSNLRNLMYLLCVLYTMMFSSMAHYCKQNDLRRKLEKEKKELIKENENLRNNNYISIDKYKEHLSDEIEKTEIQKLREMIESLKNSK
jgi:Tfp pilus assembly protein PilO